MFFHYHKLPPPFTYTWGPDQGKPTSYKAATAVATPEVRDLNGFERNFALHLFDDLNLFLPMPSLPSFCFGTWLEALFRRLCFICHQQQRLPYFSAERLLPTTTCNGNLFPRKSKPTNWASSRKKFVQLCRTLDLRGKIPIRYYLMLRWRENGL